MFPVTKTSSKCVLTSSNPYSEMSAWLAIHCIFLNWVLNTTEAIIPFTVKRTWPALPEGTSGKMNLWLSRRLQRSTRDVSRRQLSLWLWTQSWWGLVYGFSIHNNCCRPTGPVDSYVVLLTGTASNSIRWAIWIGFRVRLRLGLGLVRVQNFFLAGALSRSWNANDCWLPGLVGSSANLGQTDPGMLSFPQMT